MSEQDQQESVVNTGSSSNPTDLGNQELNTAQSMIGRQSTEIGELRARLKAYEGQYGDILNPTDNPSPTPVDNTPRTTEVKPKENDKPSNIQEDASLDNLQKVAEEHKLDWEELETDYYKNNGKLSPELEEKILKAGVPKELVDNAITGLQAQQKEEYAQVASAVGGLDELNAVLGWVAQSYSEEEKIELNASLKNVNLKTAQFIVQGLRNEMLSKEGTAPNYVKGTSGGSGAGKVFRDRAEMTAYLNDPRAKLHSPTYSEAYMNDYNEIIKRTEASGIAL